MALPCRVFIDNGVKPVGLNIHMRYQQIILESPKKYLPMVKSLTNVANDEKIDLMLELDKIEKGLKRQDRVIWYTRWFRFDLIFRHVSRLRRMNVPQDSEPFLKAQGLLDKAAKEVGMSISDADREWLKNGDFASYKHFANTPSQEIQQMVWHRQKPSDLLVALREAETKWQETRKQQVHHSEDDEPEIFMDFGNGWAWYDLNRSSCDVEADAMGHCGNSGGRGGETILSLRRHMGDEMYRPSLTFILTDDGYLGEMKGRANEKPAERYHDMIIALLMDDRIVGINGGGYAAHSNFSLRDLDDEAREEILAKKPSLKEIPDLWDDYKTESETLSEDEKAAIEKRIISGLKDDASARYDSLSRCKIDLQRGVIVVWRYSDINDYLDMNFSYCKWLAEFFEKQLPDAVERILPHSVINSRGVAERVANGARSKLFLPLFKELLPIDHDYKASGDDDEMRGELMPDRSIEIVLEIDRYFDLFWGEDSVENRRWIKDSIDEVIEHRNNNIDREHYLLDPEHTTDELSRLIFAYLGERENERDNHGKRKSAKVPDRLAELAFAEFKNSGSTYVNDPDQYELDLGDRPRG